MVRQRQIGLPGSSILPDHPLPRVIRVGSLKTSWKSTLRRAKINRRLRLYDLRHFAITSMIRQGDLKTVSQIAGHSREGTMFRVYA